MLKMEGETAVCGRFVDGDAVVNGRLRSGGWGFVMWRRGKFFYSFFLFSFSVGERM